jgi:glutamate-1-semialdehyde aminotransferase
MDSIELFTRAKKVIPGGVNSPVRAFKAVGKDPIFIEKALGSRIWSAEKREYLDFCGSWGPAILGHAHPEINNHCTKNQYAAQCVNMGSMFTLFFCAPSILKSLTDVKRCNTDLFRQFYSKMLDHGIYFPPSQFETAFISAAHSEEDINFTIVTICTILDQIFKENIS